MDGSPSAADQQRDCYTLHTPLAVPPVTQFYFAQALGKREPPAPNDITSAEVMSLSRAVACFAVTWWLTGCAMDTDRQSLGYGDYVGYTCDQLGQEALRLMRVAATRNEHLLADDRQTRDTAMRQLDTVKRASRDKRC